MGDGARATVLVVVVVKANPLSKKACNLRHGPRTGLLSPFHRGGPKHHEDPIVIG